ncbi:hypothetical protein Tco_0851755 [Tanacetum coccineum]
MCLVSLSSSLILYLYSTSTSLCKALTWASWPGSCSRSELMPDGHQQPYAYKKNPSSKSISSLSSIKKPKLSVNLSHPVRPHNAPGAHESPASK